jgi:hypothetical protein
MPNLVEHVENRIGKLPNVLLYLKDTVQVLCKSDVLDSDYIEKYIPKRNLLFVMQEP